MTIKIVPRPDNQRPNEWVLDMMKERGSLSPLRYPYAHRIESIVDVEFEECSPAVYLATPVTPHGTEWLRRFFRDKTRCVWFCNSFVLSREHFRALMQRSPDDDICTQISFYMETTDEELPITPRLLAK